eukprot:TRINITY_DN16076_c0_g1_i1.p1 TRINITY_DN16076_c0_g1~~TRINITY_DN16076_c0_g1_i1.p1  ORF type:complete len:183 (-),score=44.13 TRINITY_DN16076_c0_g1_i1:138-662(-)
MGEYQEAKEELGRSGIMLSLCTVFWAFALIVCSIPFWIAIYTSVNTGAATGASFALNIIFGIVLVILGICGMASGFRYAFKWLDMFAFVNAAMFIIQFIQLIIGYITYEDCRTNSTPRIPNSPFAYICEGNANDIWFWASTIAMLVVNLFAAFAAFSFSQKIKLALDPPLDHYK